MVIVFETPAPTKISFGTHNTHDLAGEPTFFADIVLFTEAIASRITSRAPRHYHILVCEAQKDLVVAYNADLFVYITAQYYPAHKGVEKVTPHRGTYVVLLRHIKSGKVVAVVVEHRINAAFFPFVRGEAAFRRACWRGHTKITLRVVRQLKAKGYVVLAGGDINISRLKRAYRRTLREVGTHFDRLAASQRLHNFTYLGKKKSDHPRLYAETYL